MWKRQKIQEVLRLLKSRVSLVFFLTTLLGVLAFPNVNFAEAAYGFLVPLTLFAASKPSRKTYLKTAFCSSLVLWVCLLYWLYHVTWAGFIIVLFLAFLAGLFYLAWFIALRWVVGRVWHASFIKRTCGFLGLAGLWVLLEWCRTFFLGGVLWLPLAATQWERPAMLQIAAWTGAYGISFLIVLCNLWIARACLPLVNAYRDGSRGFLGRVSPEFYAAFALIFINAFIFMKLTPWGQERESLFEVGIVQPDTPAELKWNTASARENIAVLAEYSHQLAAQAPDFILWPEAATPFPMYGGSVTLTPWIVPLVDELNTPIVLGNLTFGEDSKHAYNAIFLVEPDTGVASPYYSKIQCVPFGEYVPFPKIFGILGKVVPLPIDILPGRTLELIPFEARGKRVNLGGLICYEDIFPGLARSAARLGADCLVVVTNDAWFGQSAAAYQHASHSVLRAVETRRPVIRCGNNGWSGWIDEYGVVRHIVTDNKGQINFRGTGVLSVERVKAFAGLPSFYVRHGDWFVCLSACFVAIALFLGLRERQE
tara:strand:- start:7794 stop:9410 length:1617 start_codon:yes stop_codon:yes gene_type:complete